jgi:cell division protein FtsQ
MKNGMQNTFVKYRKWWILLGITALVVFCLFFFRVKEVTIEGNSYYSENEMAEMFQDNVFEKNILSFWLMDKLSFTPDLPFVTEYEITYPSVNEVHICLYEKTIVAGISYMGQYIYFDNEGTVLKSTQEAEEKIPLFETKNLTTFTLYSKVKMEDESLLEQILNLANLFQHYEVDWDTVTFNEDNEAVLYTGDITVKLGKRDNYDEQISALASILEQAKEKKLKGTMDLTGYDVKGTVIFTEDK